MELKYNTVSLWASSQQITSPSIKLVDPQNGNRTLYVPLIPGAENAEVTYNGFIFKLSRLTAAKGSTKLRAPVLCRVNKTINGTLSGNITHSGASTEVRNYQTITRSGNWAMNDSTSGTFTANYSVTLLYGVTFSAVTGSNFDYSGATNGRYVSRHESVYNSYAVVSGAMSGFRHLTGQVKATITGYTVSYVTNPESKSVYVTQTVDYGYTFDTVPTVTVSGATLISAGVSSCVVGATLSGTVNSGTKTLYQGFSVNIQANIPTTI